MTINAPDGLPGADASPVMRARALRHEAMAWLTPRLSWHRAALGLFILLAIIVVATFADYGVTWDEDVHNWYGVFVLDYYLTLFKDGRCLNWLNLYNYGAAFDTIAAALNYFSPFGTYETRHLLNGFFGVLGVVGSWKLGRSLGGPRAGFIAALLLLAIPNYYGQMFNNPKDIPFAVGMVWAIYYMVRIVPLLPRPKWSLVAKLGVATGMALGVRVGGLLLFCYLGLLLLSSSGAPPKRRARAASSATASPRSGASCCRRSSSPIL
jgi:asparagine N-glycosylation enzyme membrane subunit Stt3